MSAQPPEPSGPDSDDPIGIRYPNTARIWNYQLGGKDNLAIDREASDAANAMVRGLGVPDGSDTAVESRHLLQRMVDYMLGQGVRQFLDLGSGLPNMANTHQIAHRAAPDARIVYADVDPLVSSHAAALIDGFTLVEPGLVRPAQWRPDLDNPLRKRGEDDGDDGPVLRRVAPEQPEGAAGAAWHFCGIGLKDQP